MAKIKITLVKSKIGSDKTQDRHYSGFVIEENQQQC